MIESLKFTLNLRLFFRQVAFLVPDQNPPTRCWGTGFAGVQEVLPGPGPQKNLGPNLAGWVCAWQSLVIYIRIIYGGHFQAIFGSFLNPFLVHFWSFWCKQTRMKSKMRQKMKLKMVTVNALKCKCLKNEAKMHFACTLAVLAMLSTFSRT